MVNLLEKIKESHRFLCSKTPFSSKVNEFKLKLAIALLPKDLVNLLYVIIDKLNSKYQKLDPEKRKKILELVVDFELRD